MIRLEVYGKAVVVIAVKRPCWRVHSRRHSNQTVEPVAMASTYSQTVPVQSVARRSQQGNSEARKDESQNEFGLRGERKQRNSIIVKKCLANEGSRIRQE